MYTSKPYGYGRFEARLRFAPGDGVVSSFFLWKDGSEQAGAFWNELDFEKVGAGCTIQTNPIYGNPSANHVQKPTIQGDLCGAYHTYAYEWTPDAIVWLVDGVEVRRETGAVPDAFAQNASGGMQMHFNVWPGDSTFGGNFDPAILPVHQYIDWVQFSGYQAGAFTLSFREDFNATTLPDGWLTGNWSSPKNHSTHAPENVNLVSGYAVLSLTADNALGATGAMPGGPGAGGASGTAGGPGTAGSPGTAGGPGTAGAGPGSAGSGSSSAGSPGTGGAPAVGGSSNAAGATGLGGAVSAVAGNSGSGATNGTAGAGVGTSGAPGSMAGASNGTQPNSDSSGCSFGASPKRGSTFWLIGIGALAYLHRRARRGLGKPRA